MVILGLLLIHRTGSIAGLFTSKKSEAYVAGKSLTNNHCAGEGVPYKLSVSPMKADQFSIVVPYGLMVGDHVTPIDHQYFGPQDQKSAPDSYEVRAMADSRIVDITTRPRPFGREYRLVFSVSCTFLYYYDLVTSLTPDLEAAYNKANSGILGRGGIDVPVKAGQLIGRIGGQTLDFAVWDTTKPLTGFIVPEHYEAERWKLYTADPLDYYTDDLKKFILSRYVRTAKPISGKIDYDIDGRLIGNWFLEGTNGYEGIRPDRNKPQGYAKSHLSFSPNLYVPTVFHISMGDYGGKFEQFVSDTNSPRPQDVSKATGLVKYNLVKWEDVKPDGTRWDNNTLVKGVKLVRRQEIMGCAVVQMLETRQIKFQAFPGKSCATVAGFTSAAKLYTR